MSEQIKTFFDKDTFSCTHLVSDPDTGKSIIIDSVLDFDLASGKTSTKSADLVLEYMAENGLSLDYIFETHCHADHITAAPYLAEKTGAKTAISTGIITVQKVFSEVFDTEEGFKCDGSQFDILLEDGAELQFGNLQVKAMHTTGHTPSCVTYVIGNAAFVGDTLFMPDFGTARCDFPNGNARELYRSIQKTLSFSDDTQLYMCHDYGPGGRDIKWITSVKEQKEKNIHIKSGTSEEDYVAMRESRDATLSVPKLLLPSVQVNMRGGMFPPKGNNGVSYLKLPITEA